MFIIYSLNFLTDSCYIFPTTYTNTGIKLYHDTVAYAFVSCTNRNIAS